MLPVYGAVGCHSDTNPIIRYMLKTFGLRIGRRLHRLLMITIGERLHCPVTLMMDESWPENMTIHRPERDLIHRPYCHVSEFVRSQCLAGF
jgi:hypothetical protein